MDWVPSEIGARGLSPHRTSNFNTRQNGYDISADAWDLNYTTHLHQKQFKIEIVRGVHPCSMGHSLEVC